MNTSLGHLPAKIDHARANGMEIRGEIFGEMLCRYPRMLVGDGGDMLFRLCAPVRAKE